MDISNSIAFRQLRQFFERSVDRYPNHVALVCDSETLTYQALDEKVNQFAHYLIHQGIHPNHYVGIFLERSIFSYIAILAVLKTGAAYVPIEIEYPDDRVNYILADLPFAAVITSKRQFERQQSIQFPATIIIDELQTTFAKQSIERPVLQNQDAENLCYVIYTSGSTGKPKGVEITHRSICHYVTVASDLYQMTANDRVYQGFSLAFDASLEELWMAFANGAALIACTSKDTRSGVGLIQFLTQHQVTFFSTVPTLLATLEANLPFLRLLILGGEACMAHLIKSWSREGLKIMNTYGPTEATVITSYTECEVGNPITIGKPLPGHILLILDEQLNLVPDGQQGQLCIAGVGLARGYVNRPEITAQKFIQNPHDKTQKLYLTGDLALKNAEGNIEFLGRIDSQIKLRGFRIELDEIETVMMEYAEVNQAVVALQETNKQNLVAYLLLNKQNAFDIQQFKHFLQQRLPHYMMPNLFEIVSAFPLLSSGKVDRKSLPKPKGEVVSKENIPPQTELESTICKIWEDSLQQSSISIDDDFFYDLGGHSLTAAKIVSSLRKMTQIESISILDLYQNPTIRQLAEKFSCTQKQHKNTDEQKPRKNRVANLTYYLCGIGQFFGCLLQYAIGAWQLLVVVLCYSWLNGHVDFLSVDTLTTFLLLFLGIPISSLSITILAKWILIGRVKPGVHKLWGWFYLRWWLVERLQRNIFSPRHLIGSPLITLYYRLMGAKIGRNCYIGTANVVAHDMIDMGDNCSIGFDARILGYVIEDGWLKIGPVTIGNQCFVGARSVISINTVMHDKSCLDDMSMLPMHRHIPAKQFYSGSPARLYEAAPEHIVNQGLTVENSSRLRNLGFGILHYFGLVFAITLYYICYLPALLLITQFHEQTHYLFTLFFAAPVGAVIFLGLYYFGIGAVKKLVMNRIKPGIYPVKSLYYLRQWIVSKLLDVDEVNVMADTLYFPYLLRFLGAKLGKRVEMGETPHIIPDLVTIKDEGFTASAVALAWPSVFQGSIKFAPVEIGKRGFVGNDSLLPLGANIGDGGLLGCMTITPPNNNAANHHTAWLGSPAIHLPKRELSSEFSDSEKFTPPKKLFVQRLMIEFFRIILPTTFTLVALFNLLYVLEILLNEYSLPIVLALFPIAELLVMLGLVGVVVALKWVMLGRIQPATKPIWNIFIWKNDVITNLYHYFLASHFTQLVLGTPFVALLYRCFGAKIGKRAFINSDDFTEFDMISLGNEVCVNAEAVIQTHLYEDRIFKMSKVDVHDGCNIGVASIVLYNAVMEKNASLGNFSLLMKGETLPSNTSWQGIPAQPLRQHESDIRIEETIDVSSEDGLVLEVD